MSAPPFLHTEVKSYSIEWALATHAPKQINKVYSITTQALGIASQTTSCIATSPEVSDVVSSRSSPLFGTSCFHFSIHLLHLHHIPILRETDRCYIHLYTCYIYERMLSNRLSWIMIPIDSKSSVKESELRIKNLLNEWPWFIDLAVPLLLLAPPLPSKRPHEWKLVGIQDFMWRLIWIYWSCHAL